VFKTFAYGFFTGVIIIAFLWFFVGRLQLAPLLDTTAEIRIENKRAESIGNSISEGLNRMELTVASLDQRGNTIESGSDSISNRSESLIERSSAIETGLTDFGDSVREADKRNGRIVGIVGQLRDINEEFRETIESSNMEN